MDRHKRDKLLINVTKHPMTFCYEALSVLTGYLLVRMFNYFWSVGTNAVHIKKNQSAETYLKCEAA